MDELIPDLLNEKDMKSAWKNKPLRVIGLVLLFLVDFAVALIPAGLLGDSIEKIKLADNLEWLINILHHIAFGIVFIVCLVLLIVIEYLIIGLIVCLKNKE